MKLEESKIISREVYERAEKYLPWNAYKYVKNAYIQPNWIGKSERFWYVKNDGDKKEFIFIDPDKKIKRHAFDHVRLIERLSQAAGKSYSYDKLPFSAIEFDEGNKFIKFNIKKKRWSCNLNTYECKKIKVKEKISTEWLLSPDKKWAAFLKDHNLYVRSIASGKEFQLTDDGKLYNDYATSPESNTYAITIRRLNFKSPPIALWSPDSKRILTFKIDQRKVKEMHLIQSVGLGGSSRPILHSYRYPLPEDEDRAPCKLVIFDVEQKSKIIVDHEPQPIDFLSPIEHKRVWWNKEGTQIYFIFMDKGYKKAKLYEINPLTGSSTMILEEEASTFIDLNLRESNKPNVYTTNSHNNEIIWFSQKDGWGHLYLHNGKTGKLKNQITYGEWVVHDIIHVAEEKRLIYFTAGGREQGRDPYYKHLYRINFDENDLKLLTPEDSDHDVIFSPSGNYFIDNFSTVDSIPTSKLRDENGELVLELEHANMDDLMNLGWKAPEPLKVRAHDGKTDLYGLIYYPSNFDPHEKYPVIDYIYPGPQQINTPKAFPQKFNTSLIFFWKPQAIAELGFVVIIIDGFGTPFRSKAFHDFQYGNMGKAGCLEDHIFTFEQLAKTRPYMDLERVGIFGHSGGGYASTRAILQYPDFYKVAVSSAGNHDQRGYLAEWGEKYQGILEGDNYVNQINAKLARNLKGKLLISWGDMDDNVHPAMTLQVVDALIKENKDFDMLILPNRNHFYLIDAYYIRKQWDYFVLHLLGQTPPKEYKIKPPQMEFILGLASQVL